MMRLTLLVLSAFVGTSFGLLGSEQWVRVTGQVMCGEKPDTSAYIKLWDEDRGPDPDDVLGEARVDAQGYFDLQGSATETTDIDPVLKIYTDCEDGVWPGQRKLKYVIPDSYISTNPNNIRTFKFGSLNVAAKGNDEDRDFSTRSIPGLSGIFG